MIQLLLFRLSPAGKLGLTLQLVIAPPILVKGMNKDVFITPFITAVGLVIFGIKPTLPLLPLLPTLPQDIKILEKTTTLKLLSMLISKKPPIKNIKNMP
jgi:hypothetical protein